MEIGVEPEEESRLKKAANHGTTWTDGESFI
jgi:hypothetical protein